MRLHDTAKLKFIQSVMKDVPEIDYFTMSHELVLSEVLRQMPAKLRACWNDKSLRNCLTKNARQDMPYPFKYTYTPWQVIVLPKELIAELENMAKLELAQAAQRSEIQDTLRRGCSPLTTLKQLRDKYPDLVKYMPAEAVKTPNLPVAPSSVVIDMLKVAGWPKKDEPTC